MSVWFQDRTHTSEMIDEFNDMKSLQREGTCFRKKNKKGANISLVLQQKPDRKTWVEDIVRNSYTNIQAFIFKV